MPWSPSAVSAQQGPVLPDDVPDRHSGRPGLMPQPGSTAPAAGAGSGGAPTWLAPWRRARAGRPRNRRVFRMPGPLVVWWGWIVFVVANLIRSEEHTSELQSLRHL